MRMFVSTAAVCVGVCVLLFSVFGSALAASDLEIMVDAVKANNDKSAASQRKIDALSDKSRQLYDDYRLVVKEKESLEIYNKHVTTLVESQNNELVALQKQLDEVDVTSREIIPLLLRMLDSLDKFVELDIPFLVDERKKRLASLQNMMTRADVTVAEQYRRLMEAYLVELEYGRTIEAYESQIELGGKMRSVNFLRVGRIMLAYQSPDKSVMGIWNNTSRQWAPLDSDYHSSITTGLRIARRQAAPDLIRLPLPSPEHAQ